MPQYPPKVATGPTGAGKALRVDEDGNLISALASNDDSIPTVTITTGTIAVSNTFQQVIAADATRVQGGLIQNHGTATMSVFFGAIGGATIAKSVTLAAATGVLMLNDLFGPGVYQGAISMTGTAADAFLVVTNSGTS